MRTFKRVASLALVLMLGIFFSGCRLTPIDARTIEDLRGTYELTEYYAEEDGEISQFLPMLKYFYLVVSDESAVRVVYKGNGADENYVAGEYAYVCKYKSGSTEEVQEIKVKFDMPYSGNEPVTVNYFTVSPDDTMVCQKITYKQADVSGAPTARRIVYIKLTKVSGQTDYGYVEGKVGHKIEVVEGMFSSKK